MINWDEVTVGETRLTTIDAMLPIYVVIGMSGSEVWCRDIDTFDCTTLSRKSFSDRWTIYDPWGEITDECEWAPTAWNLIGWVIRYKGNTIECSNPNFKSNGRRVWKRKEG